MADFFNKEASINYDAKNSRLAPIADSMHFLIRLILKDLPRNARILCIGVGTGAEILSLGEEYPEWEFLGVDPSESMLDVCQTRLQDAGLTDRCKLVHGYIEDIPAEENFDAVLSILVGHFIEHNKKTAFYKDMRLRLKKDGYFINTEISYDLNSTKFPSMLENWARVQEKTGATPDSLKALPHILKDVLSVSSPADIETSIRAGGISLPVRFFQAFMICGWYGKKT